MKTKAKQIKDSQVFYHIPLSVLVIMALVPVCFATFYSLRSMGDIYGGGLLSGGLTLENFARISESLPILNIVKNTLMIAVTVTIAKLVTSIMAAYALAFFNFKCKDIIYFILISTMFIPFTVTMIPNYITISKLGFFDSVFGVMLPQLADVSGIFLIRQTMRTIPKSLLEVTQLDNIGRMRALKDIILPICKPSIIATGIIFFINSWNEYVWPTLVLRSEDNYTLAMAMHQFSSAEAGVEFTVIMAMAVIAMIIPVALYLVFQKQIINSFASSGIKG